MRIAICLPLILLAACSDVTAPSPSHQITTQDLMMNRPNHNQLETRFRMFDNGQGTVEFLNGDDGPQPVAWTLRNELFCLTAEQGLIASFGCASVSVQGNAVTFSHSGSDSVVRGVMVARPASY